MIKLGSIFVGVYCATLPFGCQAFDANKLTSDAATDAPLSDATDDANQQTDVSSPPGCAREFVVDVIDDFEDNAADPFWSVYEATTDMIAETDGMLEIQLQASAASLTYAGYISSTGYPLSNSSAYVEVIRMGGTTTSAQTYFNLTSAGNIGVSLVQAGSQLRFRKINGSLQEVVSSTSYSGSTHRFWRIRESAGTVYTETSPDAALWTELGSVDTSEAFLNGITDIRIEMGAGTYQSVIDPGIAQFDNLNGGGGTPSDCQ
ncbi:MAG: hypothetical protein IPJ88_18250 [Myxococcales bacterium]|nr:MAG: hypothetical protein IPJ88_18250 [Myxococcales bacterium]